MKVAIITGATRGIGRAAAELFFDRGYRIVNVSRTRLERFEAANVEADFSLPDWDLTTGPALAEHLVGARTVVLIHNAARFDGGSTFEAPASLLSGTLAANVTAPYRLSQLVRPALTPGSSILFVGSTLGEKAVSGFAPYIISKHATIGLMRSTCQDLAGTGVHTACVCPGFTDTEMLRERAPEGALAAIAAQVTFGRLIEPLEIARCLLFCAENPVINGAVLHANLGQIER